MSQHDQRDARLAQALGDLADARVPDYTPDVLVRTRRTRQRPGWTFIERRFDMTTMAQRAQVAQPLALIPSGLLMLIVVGLLMALAVAGLAVGGRLSLTQAVLPAQVTGLAANGLIAFERGLDIWVVEPDGSGERPLITGPGGLQQPTWSPDGTRIAYLSYARGGDKGPTDVIVANADGTGAITVGTNPDYMRDPTWSPDGMRIAYASYGFHVTEDAPGDVHVANADGTGAITVATGVLDLAGVSWSPDGATLLFGGTDPPRVTPCSQVAALGGHCGRHAFTAASDGSTGAVQTGDPGIAVRVGSKVSPDGQYVLTRPVGETWHVVARDGTIAATIAKAAEPNWQRLAP